jgi:hypothetical protein
MGFNLEEKGKTQVQKKSPDRETGRFLKIKNSHN